MTSAHERHFQEEDAEQLLGALAGVVSAHIVTDAAGRMVEIHVLSTPDLHPKQVVRNVESALSAGLGIQVDRRIVSVAQIRTESANGRRPAAPAAPATAAAAESTPAPGAWVRPDAKGEPVDASPESAGTGLPAPAASGTTADPATAGDRLEYVRYEARRAEDRCSCQVVLRSGSREVTGTGEGLDTAVGRAESAARAVLDAIGRARPELRLKLEAAVISSSRGRSFVIVSAHALQGRTTVPLAGAAALNRSPEEAAILATLQASNRWSG